MRITSARPRGNVADLLPASTCTLSATQCSFLRAPEKTKIKIRGWNRLQLAANSPSTDSNASIEQLDTVADAYFTGLDDRTKDSP